MYTLSYNMRRWRISKQGHIVLSGIGTPAQGLAVANAFGLILSNFVNLNYLKRVA